MLQLTERDQPLLGMGDDRWEGRVLLGMLQNDLGARGDWGLQFTSPGGPLASIGVIGDQRSQPLSGTLFIRNQNGKTFKAP